MGHLLPTIQKMCFWFLRLLYGFQQQGAQRLAGFLIEIYIGFTVLSCVRECVCVWGAVYLDHVNIKGIFPFHIEKYEDKLLFGFPLYVLVMCKKYTVC